MAASASAAFCPSPSWRRPDPPPWARESCDPHNGRAPTPGFPATPSESHDGRRRFGGPHRGAPTAVRAAGARRRVRAGRLRRAGPGVRWHRRDQRRRGEQRAVGCAGVARGAPHKPPRRSPAFRRSPVPTLLAAGASGPGVCAPTGLEAALARLDEHIEAISFKRGGCGGPPNK